MKLLLDFLPILLFFGMFKYAEGQPEWAAATASHYQIVHTRRTRRSSPRAGSSKGNQPLYW